MAKTNSTVNAFSAESLASDILCAKGAELRVAGFLAAVLPLATRAYKHGSDREQWQGKGNASRPLRGPWAIAFPIEGKVPQTAAAKAFRAIASEVLASLANKARDKSDDGITAFEEQISLVAMGFFAPTAKATATDEGAKALKALEKAVSLVSTQGASLSETQALALRQALAAYEAATATATAKGKGKGKATATATATATA